MTAEIAILNKNGVALAADSVASVSVQEGTEKFITVEKIFNISKHHPVGIMIYDSADFTDIPCETIIKIYRLYIGNKYFDTLQEYADDFLKFLSKDKRVYNSGYEKRLIRSVLDYCLMENMPRSNLRHKRDQTLGRNVEEKIKDFLEQKFLKGFDDNFIQLFLETHGEYLKGYMNGIDNINIDNITRENIVLLCAYIISKSYFLINNKPSTGIVIAGYGNKELFPSLTEYKIIGVICGTLIYKFINREEVGIEESNVESTFVPFAQRDVVDTYTKGIDTQIQEVIFENINNIFNNFFEVIQSESNNRLTHQFSSAEKDIINKVGKKLNNKIKEEFENIQNDRYTKPFSTMVKFLGKGEMTFLAEALVNLTSTRRRFTTDKESVGGSTDVVIITKGDGFTWVKKKQFLKPELNAALFNTR